MFQGSKSFKSSFVEHDVNMTLFTPKDHLSGVSFPRPILYSFFKTHPTTSKGWPSGLRIDHIAT